MKNAVVMLKKQAGLAITDLLIWGAGIILVLGVIAGFAGLATDSSNSINYTSNLNVIKTCAVKYMQGVTDKTAVTTERLVQAKCVPGSWVKGTGLVSPEGGQVNVVSTSVSGGTNNGFLMTVNNISSAACNGIMPALATNYLKITVNGTVVKAEGATSIDPTVLSTACNQGQNNAELIFIS